MYEVDLVSCTKGRVYFSPSSCFIISAIQHKKNNRHLLTHQSSDTTVRTNAANEPKMFPESLSCVFFLNDIP